MQRNKYLEELNIPIENYGTNFIDEKDPRLEKWKVQKEEYGFDETETWNLDQIFVEWLYSHLMMYKEKASKVVDLTYKRIEFQNKEYTLEQAIDFILEALKANLVDKKKTNETWLLVEEAILMWAKIANHCWW